MLPGWPVSIKCRTAPCIGGRLGVFDITTSEVTEESDYHNVVERLRDPSHTTALPLSELVQLLGLVGLQVDKIETIVHDLDVEDWIARAEQSANDAQRAGESIAAAIGTRKFGGKRVWRDEDGKLCFSVRWAILVATKPS